MLHFAPVRRMRAAVFGVLVLAGAVGVPAAQADGPGVGTPNVVIVGDSYISGEAGRWAGNASSESYVDALGSTAYYDNASNTGESIPAAIARSRMNPRSAAAWSARTCLLGCEDSNLALREWQRLQAGARLLRRRRRHIGQAKALQSYASTHNVNLVAISIGGNDYRFADIVQQCVQDFLLSPSWWPDYCKDDSLVTGQMAASNVTAKTTAIKNAILRVNTAMANAGYSSSQFTLLVQTYPSPIPNGAGFRYSQSATRVRTPAAAASGTPTRTTRTARCSRRSTTRF
jgi:hypothetical protein